MLTWTIGEVTVSALVETELRMPAEYMFHGATKAEIDAIDWATPNFVTEAGELRLAIQALLIRTPTHRMIVDTCLGNEKQRPYDTGHMLNTDLLQRLEAAGFGREAVDVVVCTHLHIDHVGWNTMLENGRWVPTFTKARYLFGRREYAFWSAGSHDEGDTAVFADSVKPVFEAGLVDLVETNHRICDEIRLIPTEGHTPGHVSVVIESGGQRAMITGDFLHNPVQMARPDWGVFVDVDRAQAEATRRRMLEEAAGQPLLVIGTHFAAPTAGHVQRDGEGYRLV